MMIKGENISLYINGDLMSCWRSSQIDITADTLGTSTVGSGNWKEFVGVALSWTASGEGQIYNDVAFSIHDAYHLMITLANVDLIFTVEDKDSTGAVLNTSLYTGTAIITSINLTGSVNNIASYNIAFQGTGELVRTETELELIIDTDLVEIADSDNILITDSI